MGPSKVYPPPWALEEWGMLVQDPGGLGLRIVLHDRLALLAYGPHECPTRIKHNKMARAWVTLDTKTCANRQGALLFSTEKIIPHRTSRAIPKTFG